LAADRWRVVSVELPGRERRILQTPYRNVCDAAKGSVEDILTVLGEGARIVLFGPSLGAVLAHELVHRPITTRCRPALAAFYASIWRKVPHPQSLIALASDRLRTMFCTASARDLLRADETIQVIHAPSWALIDESG
jgi:surfactin synthase thioesterase subunit